MEGSILPVSQVRERLRNECLSEVRAPRYMRGVARSVNIAAPNKT
jgi:hypothetical protein